MTVKEKQEFEANFNCIGHFLIEQFEKADAKKRKKIGLLIGNVNYMYKYTNKLETKLITIKYGKDKGSNS